MISPEPIHLALSPSRAWGNDGSLPVCTLGSFLVLATLVLPLSGRSGVAEVIPLLGTAEKARLQHKELLLMLDVLSNT